MMSPDNTTQLVLALLGFALVAGLLGWSPYGRSVWPPVSMTALAAAAVVAALADELSADRVEMTLLVAVAGLLAVAGGGPLTTRIFAIVDSGQPAVDSITNAGAILKGGAWIGALERLAVFAGLAAGFPEGVAVVLALKGVGRFPDLRGDSAAGGATTERFIIGTFTSVLWAAACVGVVALVRR
ncbi:MAG: hypothetical protein QOD98_955 [Nocardioidaceae bacterium]|nr:hypothetical protein [Nocardioidaceae bacterium]